MIFAAVSKLPHDLLPVMSILPFWMTILYYAAWILGAGLVFVLLVLVLKRVLEYLQVQQQQNTNFKNEKSRQYSREAVLRDLKSIFESSLKSGEYREALHQMNASLKTYFEILFSEDIEEMTAKEIEQHMKSKPKLGLFFTQMRLFQFSRENPQKETVEESFKNAETLVREERA